MESKFLLFMILLIFYSNGRIVFAWMSLHNAFGNFMENVINRLHDEFNSTLGESKLKCKVVKNVIGFVIIGIGR